MDVSMDVSGSSSAEESSSDEVSEDSTPDESPEGELEISKSSYEILFPGATSMCFCFSEFFSLLDFEFPSNVQGLLGKHWQQNLF